MPKVRIADELGIDRKTVARHAADAEPPKYVRAPVPSVLDPYKDYIRQRLSKYDLTAMKLFAEIEKQGYAGSYPVVQRFVKAIRPVKPKPAFVRFETAPGQQAQVDWSPFGRITYLGLKRGQCGDDVRQKSDEVVVILVQRNPDERILTSLVRLVPPSEESCFAEPGRCGDESERMG